MGEIRAAQVQPGRPTAGGPADTFEIPSPRLGAAHPDPLGDVADNGMQYGRSQPSPPWAAAIPGRHGCRDARGYTLTAAHEVNSRRATQLPATAPAKPRYATTKRLRVEVEGLHTQLARTRRRPNQDRIKVFLLSPPSWPQTKPWPVSVMNAVTQPRWSR